MGSGSSVNTECCVKACSCSYRKKSKKKAEIEQLSTETKPSGSIQNQPKQCDATVVVKSDVINDKTCGDKQQHGQDFQDIMGVDRNNGNNDYRNNDYGNMNNDNGNKDNDIGNNDNGNKDNDIGNKDNDIGNNDNENKDNDIGNNDNGNKDNDIGNNDKVNKDNDIGNNDNGNKDNDNENNDTSNGNKDNDDKNNDKENKDNGTVNNDNGNKDNYIISITEKPNVSDCIGLTNNPVIDSKVGTLENVVDYIDESADMACSTSSDPIEALEKRQDAIFAKLKDLQDTLGKLTGQYGAVDAARASSSSQGKSVASKASATKLQGQVQTLLGNGIHDVVISADPDSPPLSLFILYEMLKQQYKVLATSYVHSSVVNIDQRLCDLIKNGCQVTRGEHQIALSVVWKKVVNGPLLMISPTKQSVVSGEVNVARYINRLLSPGFDTEDIVQSTYIDEWLDVADVQLIHGNSKQRTAALKTLNARLKKNEWMYGDSFSLVDIVMWSALHQSQQANSAPENVKKWMVLCEGSPLFKTALTLKS